MFKSKTDERSFRIREGNLGEAFDFAKSLLTRKDINDETAKEAQLVFEALLQKLVDWGLDENTELNIKSVDLLGDYRIQLGFEGKLFVRDESDEFSLEDRLLDAHDDKLTYSYHSGYNTISISVNRAHRTSMLACTIASLLAVVAYLILCTQLNADEQYHLLNDYVFPLETLYGNALLMVGAPMTFFSLLKNLTDTYVVSQRESGLRQLHVKTLITSVIAIALAFVTFFITASALSSMAGALSEFGRTANRSFADVVTSLVPPSIFEPFEAVSPIPLMVVALLCTYGLCSSGKYFDVLRHAMMACYTLFSRMLHVILAVLPIFCFLAIMDILLDTHLEGFVLDLVLIVFIYLGILMLLATYAIRLRVSGVRVIPFVRKLMPLIRENATIGSAIDAAPYNIRFCVRTFKMDRAMLERNLPVLAETNLDGNCFVLMSLTLVYAFVTDTALSSISFFGLAALVLFLSLGAPNQPGSILIGTLIITMYLQSFDMVAVAIFAEAFLGVGQNLVNVLGDIVMVAIQDRKDKARG